jgi:pimeloyl-ACP methyl ester carboxylesterase
MRQGRMRMKRLIKIMVWVIAIILGLWLVLAQFTLSFRNPDSQAIREFGADSVTLTTATLNVQGHHLHYASTGSDSLPTLFFIHGTPGSWDAFADYMKDKDLLARFRMVSIDRPGFGYSDYGHPEHLAQQSKIISPLFQALDNHRPMFIGVFSGLVIISGSIDPAQEQPERWRPILFKTPLTYFVPGAMRPSNQELWYLKTDLQDLKTDFAKVSCPVYLIHGAKDTWVPPENVAYGMKMLSHARHTSVTMIPGANHFIPWTKFNEIKAILLTLK